MVENKNKFLNKFFEFGVFPILILIIGLTIEYKTGIFQNVVDNKNDFKTEAKLIQTKPLEQNLTKMIDSIQSSIFDDGYSIFKQKEIEEFQLDIRVNNDIIKDEKSTSQKIKGGKIYKTKDSVFHKVIGSEEVEFFSTSEDLFNEIVTIKNNKFYRMRTMYSENSCSINLMVLNNLIIDYPIEQTRITINNRKKKCTIVGYYYINAKEKYLKSQRQVIDDYDDLMLFWREILDEDI